MILNLKKALVPFAVVVLGVVSAFAGSTANQNEDNRVDGYVTINQSEPCDVKVECSNVLGPICTYTMMGISHDVFGKWDETDVICLKPVYKL